MADVDNDSNAVAQHGGIWGLSERLIGSLFQWLRRRRQAERELLSPRASPRSSPRNSSSGSSGRGSRHSTPKASPTKTPRVSPITSPKSPRRSSRTPSLKRTSRPSPKQTPEDTNNDRINRRQRIREYINRMPSRKTLMPFLSAEHSHKDTEHDKCFAPHLIDAVRLHKLVTRLQEEQAESEKRVLDLQAKSLNLSMELEAMRQVMWHKHADLMKEHEANIKSCLEEVEQCKKDDEERKKKLPRVLIALQDSMKGLFQTVSEYSKRPDQFPIQFHCVLALKRCEKALRRMDEAIREHQSARSKAATQQPTGADISPPGPDPRLAPVQAQIKVKEARELYLQYRQDFFVNHAIQMVGDRGDLPHDLTEGNLKKLSSAKQPPFWAFRTQNPSIDEGLERQPDRDDRGRPTNNGISLLPPVDERSRQAVAEYAQIRERFWTIARRKDALFDQCKRDYAGYLVIYPRASQAVFAKWYRVDGRPFLELWRELDRLRAEHLNEVLECRSRVEAVFLAAGERKSLDPDFEPNCSDYNCSSESAPQHALRKKESWDVRGWHRSVAKNESVAPQYQEGAAADSVQLEGYPSWPILDIPDTADMEKRQERLADYNRAMDDLRLESERIRVETLGSKRAETN